MAKSAVSDWDTSAAANTDVGGVGIQGSNQVSSGDNALREIMAQIASYTRRGSDLATASTLNLDSVDAQVLDLTGTTTVTTVVLTSGHWRLCRAVAAFQITASATLVVNGSATLSYTTTADDLLFFEGYGSSVVRVWLVRTSAVAASPAGHLFGLTLSNNASDATNDIDIAVGSASSDAASPVLMTLASALTKRLDGSWAVGTGNGGLDTGSIANTTYHVWLIQRSDTGVVDALFSASATAPTMPANYDRKRRIGSIIRASGAILPFTQTGDRFLLTTPILDVDVTNQGTTGIQRTLTVPLGLAVVALIRLSGTQANGWGIIINVTDLTPSITVAPLVDLFAAAAITAAAALERVTDTSGRVYSRATGASTTVKIATYGWIDSRGRLA